MCAGCDSSRISGPGLILCSLIYRLSRPSIIYTISHPCASIHSSLSHAFVPRSMSDGKCTLYVRIYVYGIQYTVYAHIRVCICKYMEWKSNKKSCITLCIQITSCICSSACMCVCIDKNMFVCVIHCVVWVNRLAQQASSIISFKSSKLQLSSPPATDPV